MLDIDNTLKYMKVIAQGIRAHRFFDEESNLADTAHEHDSDRAKMAISILCAFISEEQQNELIAEQVRAFLVYCGFSPITALEVVSLDHEPLGSY